MTGTPINYNRTDAAGLGQVLITDELNSRPSREPDYQRENKAIAELLERLTRQDPIDVLRRLVELAIELLPAATSAGISLIGEHEDQLVFYWPVVHGRLAEQLIDHIPRDMSPCGVVIDNNTVQLFREPGRYFRRLQNLQPPIAETLLVPFHSGKQAVGTVWVISDNPSMQFDAEDHRLLVSLSGIAASCYELRLANSKTEKALASERQINETLEQRVAERTDELKRQTKAAKELSYELAEAEHHQRQKLARVLHDHLQQLLVAATMRCNLLVNADEGEVTQAANELTGLLQDAIAETRSLATELDPPALYDEGLLPALQWLAPRMQEMHGLTIHVEAEQNAAKRLRLPVATFLFEGTRELLLNVVKHAQASEAWVYSRYTEQMLYLSVEDNGVGCDPEKMLLGSSTNSMGLATLRRRMEFWGGRLEASLSSHGGCRVELTLPCSDELLQP